MATLKELESGKVKSQNSGSRSGYLLEKAGEGLVGSLEGAGDFVAGGIAKLFGDDDAARLYFEIDDAGVGNADYKFNPGSGWKIAGDVAQGIGNSLPMLATGVVGGAAVSGLVGAAGLTGTAATVATGVGNGIITFTSSFLSSAGTGVSEAYKKSGKLDENAWKSGIASGAIEGATETLVDPILGGVTSRAVKLGSQIAGNAAKATARAVSSKIGVQIAKDIVSSFISEAVEEGISGILSPIANNLIYREEIEKGEMARETLDWHDIGYQMLVGGLSGAIMGTANVAASNAVATIQGSQAIKTGDSAKILQGAQGILNAYADDDTMVNTEAFKYLQNTLANAQSAKGLMSARYIAELKNAAAQVTLSGQVVSSARNILSNPELVAERINQFGLKDASGKEIKVTAKQIADASRGGNLATALTEEDNILRKLAVLDAAGRLYADTQAYETALEQGKYLGDRADVAHFLQTATPEEVAAVNRSLGIDIASASYEDISRAFIRRAVKGKFRSETQTQSASVSENTAQNAENSAQERVEASEKSANTTEEANRAEERKAKAKETAEANRTLVKSISQWERLNSRNRTLVRQTYMRAVENGYSQEDALTFARLSAKAGINVEFTEEGMKTANGSTIDGYYDRAENVIVMNPKSKKPFESLLIHELTHSLEGTQKYEKVMRNALNSISESERERIIALYKPVMNGKTAVEKVETLNSEYTAHFTEKALKSKAFLNALVKEDATVKDKIVSFFKQRFGDEKLDRAARKLAKAYEKAFNEMAQANFGANSASASYSALNGKKIDAKEQKAIRDARVAEENKTMVFAPQRQMSISESNSVVLPSDVEKLAEDHFGTTSRWSETGYLTTDGKMLDFSGRHWGGTERGIRQVDHADIQEVIDEPAGYKQVQIAFVNRGNVRIIPEDGGFQISKMPNDTQWAKLAEYLKYYRFRDHVVDIDNDEGYTVFSHEYSAETSPQKIYDDVKSFFENGRNPYKSEIAMFHSDDYKSYSISPAEEAEYLELAKEPKKNEAELRRLVEKAARNKGLDSPMLYHGTQRFGFTVPMTEGLEAGVEWSPFFATNKKEVSGTYTLNTNVREISEDVTEDDVESVIEERTEDMRDSIRDFTRLIAKCFSEFVLGYNGDSYVESLVNKANPEAGTGDGVYDALDEIVLNAFYEYKDIFEEFEDFEEFAESDIGQEIYAKIIEIEGEYSAIYKIMRAEPNDLGGIYQLYANTDNLLVVDAKGSAWDNLRPDGLPKLERNGRYDVPYNTREVAELARDNRYSGVVFKNIYDNGAYGRTPKSDVYCFFNPQHQVRSADTVTYDDNGNIIPLSERFNMESKDDLRFSISEGGEQSSPSSTQSSVLSSRTTVPQQSVDARLKKQANRFEIDFVNEFAGIEAFLKANGADANEVESAVQSARGAYARGQSQIGYGVLDSAEMRKKGGDLTIKQPGLQKIFADVRDKGDEYAREFFDYLLHMHNVDRMRLEEKSVASLEEADRIAYLSLKDEYNNVKAEIKEIRQKIKSGEFFKSEKERLYQKLIPKLRSLELAIDNSGVEQNKPVFGNNKKEAALLEESIETLSTQVYNLKNKDNKTRKDRRDLKNAQARLKYLRDVQRDYVVREEAVTAEESERIAADYEEKHPEFRSKAEQVWEYSRQINRNRANDGLLSAKDVEYYEDKYPHYVPTFRESYSTGISPVKGKNNIAIKQTISAAEGGGGTIAPLDDSMAKQTLAAVRAGAVNRLANMIYDAASRGETDEVEIVSVKKVTRSEAYDANYEEETPKSNEITFYRDGEKITMRVSREIFAGFDAINGTIDFQNPALTMLQKVMDIFKKSVTTYNPLFVIRNKFRDVQDAGFNTKYGAKFAKMLFSGRAEREIKANSKLWQAFVAAGGMSNTAFDVNEGFQRRVGERGFVEVRNNPAAKLIDMVNIANDFVEQTTRFTEFILSIEAGNSVEQAILDSQEVTTNFGRKGRIAKKFNATISPFLNPSIQGFDKIIRNVKDATKTKQAFLSLMFKVALLGILPQVFNEFIHGFDDDDEYDELTDYVKTNNFLFKVGDVFIRIPKGRLSSAIAGAVVQTFNAAEGRNVDVKGYVENTLSQMSPVENVTRTIFSPVTDVINNRSWSGGTIESQKFENVAPEYRYDERTSSIAIALGKVLKYSPKKIHYLLDQYTGVIGDIILPATSAAAQKDMFSANMTVDAVSSNRLAGDFYDLYDEVTFKKNDPKASEEERQKASDQSKFLNRVKSAVSDLQQQKTEIQNSNKSKKEKLEETKVVQALINEAYRQAFSEYDKFTSATDKYSDIENADERFAYELRDSVSAEAALKHYNTSVYEKSKHLNTAGISYDSYFDFYFASKNLKADKDRSGNTISGSLRKKVVSEIRKTKLTVDQKLLLLASRGYKPQDGDFSGMTAESAQKRLLAYVRKVTAKMTKEEKEQFAQAFGMTVKNNLIFLQ